MTAGPVRLDVEGLHCASCVSRLETALRQQPGVLAAAVSLPRERATLEVDSRADLSQIRAAIHAIGFELQPVGDLEGTDPSERLAAASRRLFRRFALAALSSAPVVGLAMSGADSAGSRFAQGILATGVVLGLGWGFHAGALRQLRHLRADMDTLISLGSSAALVASWTALATGGPIYFETGAMIVTLILLGRALEARARGRAGAAVARLSQLAVGSARRLRDGVEEECGVEDLEVGDLIAIAPGERVPADSTVQEGSSTCNESLVTGESLPVAKQVGSSLIGASVNGSGRLVARVTRVGADSTLRQIVRAVENAQATRAPVEHRVDRVASFFVPAVALTSLGTAIAWWAIGAPIPFALSCAVAVLVIACPCALGLATPTAVMVGSGRAAELGILFKGADVFERSRGIDTVVFDKTGTLTSGEMRLAALYAREDEDAFLRRVAAVEGSTGHPIGEAVARAAVERGLRLPEVRELEIAPGYGARAEIEGAIVAVGRTSWLESIGIAVPTELQSRIRSWEEDGLTGFAAAWEGSAQGAVAVSDTIRPEAARAVGRLRDRGLAVRLISGDAEGPTRAVAQALGIEEWRARALPEEKSEILAEWRREDRTLAFIGDGVNDAPALAGADLGISIGGASDIAAESGDVVLLASDPLQVERAFEIARRTYRVIGQNLFWAFAYNTAAIPLAAFGGLDPMWAAAAMAGSSVSVVLNSLRLRSIGGDVADARGSERTSARG